MSSRRVPEVIFGATASERFPGTLFWDNNEDLKKYCIEHAGERLFIHIEPMAQVSEKMKQYAFYHKVILPCAVLGYTFAGYEGIDNVKADYLLRAEFAKDYIRKGQDYIPIVMDKRNMTKARLHKYMSDCIFFIEQELQQLVPDSGDYKISKETGRDFKKVSGK